MMDYENELDRTLSIIDGLRGTHYSTRMRQMMAASRDHWQMFRNSSLVDHAENPALKNDYDLAFPSGHHLSNLRKQRGMTLAQAAGSWSRSTLYRFENGETSIGFGRVLTLYNQLGISDLVQQWNVPQLNAYMTARATVSNSSDANSLQAACTELRAANVGIPDWVNTIERAGLCADAGGNKVTLSADELEAITRQVRKTTTWTDTAAIAYIDFAQHWLDTDAIWQAWQDMALTRRSSSNKALAHDRLLLIMRIARAHNSDIAVKMWRDVKHYPLIHLSHEAGVENLLGKLLLAYTIRPRKAVLRQMQQLAADLQFVGDEIGSRSVLTIADEANLNAMRAADVQEK